MAFNIKDFLTQALVKIKSTTDGSNGEVTHHHVDSSALPSGAATSAKQDALAVLVGEVQSSPTANTMLARLKDIVTSVLNVSPQMASGGNISAQTANPGTTYTPFGAQACKQVTVVNDTGTTILVQQGGTGVGVPIVDQSAFTFFGIANANVLGVKRKDEGNAQVTVAARWEA